MSAAGAVVGHKLKEHIILDGKEVPIAAGIWQLLGPKGELLATMHQSGMPVIVSYPYRRTRDLYLIPRDGFAFCANGCGSFNAGRLLRHVVWHHRRKALRRSMSAFFDVYEAKLRRRR